MVNEDIIKRIAELLNEDDQGIHDHDVWGDAYSASQLLSQTFRDIDCSTMNQDEAIQYLDDFVKLQNDPRITIQVIEYAKHEIMTSWNEVAQAFCRHNRDESGEEIVAGTDNDLNVPWGDDLDVDIDREDFEDNLDFDVDEK